MAKQSAKIEKHVFENNTVVGDAFANNLNSGSRLKHNYDPKLRSGACTVPGCGCPGFKDIGGTCWNINPAGGTCNHLKADHS